MLDEDAWKFSCEDARHRNAAIVSLIKSADDRAFEILKLYLTIVSAALPAASVIFFTTGTAIPKAFGFALAGLAIPLIIGAAFCFRALWTDDLSLPGRDVEFWQWAQHPEVDIKTVYSHYLDGLRNAQDANRALSDKMSTRLTKAKLAGAIAPLLFLLCLAIGFGLKV